MRVGQAEYPVLLFSEALQAAEAVKRDKVKTVDTLAKSTLGHKDATSGAFYDKAAALNKFYGLISQNKQEIELTPLGQRAVSSVLGEADRKAACRESILKVALLRDLYSKLGADFNRSDFPNVLASLTGASVQELEGKAPRLEKLYLDAVRYLAEGKTEVNGGGGMNPAGQGTPGSGQGPGSGTDSSGAGKPAFSPPPPPSGGKPVEYRQYDSGGVFIRVPKNDPDEIELAILTMQGWLEVAKKAQAKASEQAS